MEKTILNDTIQPATTKPPALSMRLAAWLDRLMLGSLHVAIFLLPLWFLPTTMDVVELNKQLLLVALTGVSFLSWLGSAALRKRLVVSRSWLHAGVGLFVIAVLFAAMASQHRYLSFVGADGQMVFAFATVAALAVWYKVASSAVKSTARAYDFLLTFLTSGAVLAIFGLCQALGVSSFNPFSVASSSRGFYPVGTMSAFSSYAAVVAVVASSLLVLGCKNDVCVLGKPTKLRPAAAAIVWVSLVLSVLSCVVADVWSSWAVMLVGAVMVSGLSALRRKTLGKPISYLAPLILLISSAVFLIWTSPFSAKIPGDVTPSPSHSWQVVSRVLQTAPLLGTGPGTWAYDYALYRSPNANLSPFWSMHFDQAFSSFYSLFATIGVVGFLAWLLLIVSVIVVSASHLVTEKDDDLWQAYLTIFSGWVALLLLGFFTNFSLAHFFAFWMFLSLLSALSAKGSFVWDGEAKPILSTALNGTWLVMTLAVCTIFWLAGQRYAASVAFTRAVVSYRADADVSKAINGLTSASQMNHKDDAIYRNLSQAYLVKAVQAFQSQSPDVKKTVADAVHASIDAAKQATQLNPANVDNWSNLAYVYQSIASFTAGADELAIQNYQEALQREPNNPTFSTEIAKIYILRADAYRTQLSSTDTKTRSDAEKNMQDQFDLAAKFLNTAIQAKSDFAPAHYALGILYEREGHVKEAIAKLQDVLSAHKDDVGVAFQLAILYYRNSDYDKAQNVLEQIEAADPTFANAPWYLSALYADAGRYDDAIAQLQRLKKAYPDNADISKRLDQYQQLKDAKQKPTPQPMAEPLPGSAPAAASPAPSPATTSTPAVKK